MKPEEADAEKLGFDPFDVTKVWPRKDFPMHEFGKLVLNKNPENYHRDVEQAAFSPGSMVPGVEDSPDPLLQFRMFFYRDAQYHRIGVNLHQVPVNCPFMSGSLSSLNFDGNMRVPLDACYLDTAECLQAAAIGLSLWLGGVRSYAKPFNFLRHPLTLPPIAVSFGGDRFRPDVAEAPYKVSDNVVSRKSHYYHEGKLSEYDQPRELYKNVMTEQARKNLHHNTAKMLSHVNYKIIQVQYLSQIYNIAPEYG
ncbi:hypothetical protein LTR56_023654 [Elasticomyces elasticus]|nr:hypothetical protein LTR56_023654 [Elasticomyces elasticus]KAK3624998.1 hypothetical protein LTR22_023747 [Elasticomyces elasticus]KAK4906595.1 hypothetical protein LTR49_024291 [Elasticomyces elasticus]KAK5768095.1 hypothetical protein LTS12_001579 [Elasticomyces elasticus]